MENHNLTYNFQSYIFSCLKYIFAAAYGNFINIRNISHSTAINKFNSTPIKAKYDPCITQHLSAKNDLTINVGNFIIPLPAIDIPTIKEVIDTTVHKSPLIDICKNSNGKYKWYTQSLHIFKV